jgi:hypothetical protein
MLNFIIILIGLTSATLFVRDIVADLRNTFPGCQLMDWFRR